MSFPNSTLYVDHWVPWAQAHGVPETPPASWKNQCGKHVFEAVSGTVGWNTRSGGDRAGGMTDDGIHDLTDETPAGGISGAAVAATAIESQSDASTDEVPPDDKPVDDEPAKNDAASEDSAIGDALANSILTMFSTIGSETPG